MALLINSEPLHLDCSRHAERPPDDVRHRALARLYERRSAVDNLISALERYQQEQGAQTAKCVTLSAGGTSR